MQLIVLDKKDAWGKQANKLLEEVEELKRAISLGDKENVAEEALDVLQVCIGMLDTLEMEGYTLKPLICKHLKKLRSRKWRTKKLIIFQVFNWDS